MIPLAQKVTSHDPFNFKGDGDEDGESDGGDVRAETGAGQAWLRPVLRPRSYLATATPWYNYRTNIPAAKRKFVKEEMLKLN